MARIEALTTIYRRLDDLCKVQRIIGGSPTFSLRGKYLSLSYYWNNTNKKRTRSVKKNHLIHYNLFNHWLITLLLAKHNISLSTYVSTQLLYSSFINTFSVP